MLGASRESLRTAQDQLDARRSAGDFAEVAGGLLAAADLLSREKSLRVALADGGQPEAARVALARSIFDGRVTATAVDVLADAAAGRWSTDGDLVDAIESLAAQAAFTRAEADGSLDQVEEELFRFGRAVDGSAPLQMALTDPALGAAAKAAVVRDLLAGRAAPVTSQLLEYLAGHLRGRRVDAAVGQLSDLAAAQRSRTVADVRSAIPLDEEQQRRLAAALSALKGRDVRLNVEVDPSVIGGLTVRVADEVIDATIASRLEQARRALA